MKTFLLSTVFTTLPLIGWAQDLPIYHQEGKNLIYTGETMRLDEALARLGLDNGRLEFGRPLFLARTRGEYIPSFIPASDYEVFHGGDGQIEGAPDDLVFAESEGLDTRDDLVFDESEGLDTRDDLVFDESEGLDTRDDLVFDESEGLDTRDDLVFAESEGLDTRDDLVFAESEGLDTRDDLVFDESEGLDTRDDLVFDESEGLDTRDDLVFDESEGLDTRDDLVFAESEGLDTRDDLVFAESEGLDTRDDLVFAESEGLDTRDDLVFAESEGLDTRDDLVFDESEGLDTRDDLVFAESEGLDTRDDMTFAEDEVLSAVEAEGIPSATIETAYGAAITPEDGSWTVTITQADATGCPPGIASAAQAQILRARSLNVNFSKPHWHPTDLSPDLSQYTWAPLGQNGYFAYPYATGPEAHGSGISLAVTIAYTVRSPTSIDMWYRVRVNLSPMLAAMANSSEACDVMILGEIEK